MGTLTTRRRKTSRNSRQNVIKFRDVVISAEPYLYDGPAPGKIAESIKALASDLMMELELQAEPAEVEELITPLRLFVDEYFKGLISRKDGHQCEIFGDVCKERYKDLVSFLNLYLSDIATAEMARIHLFSKGSGEELYSVDLSQAHYLPKRLLGFFMISEEGDVLEIVELTHRPKFFGLLYRYILKLTEFLHCKGITSFENPLVQQLFLLTGSCAQLFEKTNTSKEIIREKYIQPTLDMLTGKEAQMTDEVSQLFDAVVYDLDLNDERREHPRYVRDMRSAYKDCKSLLQSPFEEKDLYISTKATASEYKKRHHKSIIASLYESDPLRGNPIVAAYDTTIGYDSSSYYRTEELDQYRPLVTKTIWIPNPNKRKPRAIHIGMNAIQDRCKWLHRRAAHFLRKIKSDHMKNHFGGVTFLMRYTHPNYRMKHENSILNFDFSNATDTLSKEFQRRVVELFHGTAAADFWEYVSTLPKVAIMEDKETEVPYIQSVGQPQGLLWSFDAFSEAHHIIMLMVMKATGREDLSASEFYALVGDDSAINTVTADPEGSVASWYKKICDDANLIVNLGKSHITSGDPTEDIILDFAKTTVRNGQLFTPVPAGLGLAYSDKEMLGGISTLLWYNSKGIVLKRAMDKAVARNFPNYTQRLIAYITIKSGEIPYLENFKDDAFMALIPEDLKKAVLFSFLVNMTRSTVFDFCLPEAERDEGKASDITLQYAWDRVAPPQIEEMVVELLKSAPADCKYRLLLEDTFELQLALQRIYHTSICEFQSQIVAEVLHDKDLSILTEISGWISDLQHDQLSAEGEAPVFWYTFELRDHLSKVDALGELHIPSFGGQNRQKARFFKGLIPSFKEFFRGNDYIIGLINNLDPTIIESFRLIDQVKQPDLDADSEIFTISDF